ncbi:MAG: hypothetical protein U0984_15030 [Prosthecobacter sp.]|nr:hypothetical protein [Prosthecobacter sp.]
MRLILQLCLLLLVLLSTESRAWGKMVAGQNIASGGYGVVYVDCTSSDAPPTLINAGEAGPWGYELASDVRDGPNVYAYVKQNPWTAWDPDGLAWRNWIDHIVDGCAIIAGGGSGSDIIKGNPEPLQIFGTIPTRTAAEQKQVAAAEDGIQIIIELAAGRPGAGNTSSQRMSRVEPVASGRGTLEKSQVKVEMEAPAPPPTGSNNPNTRKASLRGTELHQDRPGNLPDQLRQMYPQTKMEFTPQGKPGQDVKVVGGDHPATYPGSTWLPKIDYADFKPGTPSGRRTFVQDQNNKWKQPTMMIPYDPGSGAIQVPFRPPPTTPSPSSSATQP